MTIGTTDRIDDAGSPLDLGQQLCQAARESLRLSGFSFIDLSAPARTLDDVVVWSDVVAPERAWDLFVRTVAEGDQAFGPLRELFDEPAGVHNLNARLAPLGLEQSRVFQDAWRVCGAERQALATLGTSSAPRALMLFCRRASDPAFDETDYERMAALRKQAARQLDEAHGRTGADGHDFAHRAVLDTLATAVPFPAALLDGRGRLLWMSREAAQRFDLHTSTLIDSVVVAGEGLRALRAFAQEVVAAAGGEAFDGRNRSLPGLLPGERVAVRLVEVDVRPAVLVWIVPAATPGSRLPAARDLERQGLSPREAEVALLAAEGYSIPGISGRLRIAENTVQTHLKRLYRKLGVSNRAQLAFRLFFATNEDDPAAHGGRRRVRRRRPARVG